jgi:hypothetical protein
MGTMKLHTVRLVACWVLLLLLVAPQASACSWARGHFHQVTQLKGKVVGRSLGPIQFQWLRQMFAVSGAELRLYEYDQPFRWDRKPPAVAKATTNSAGEFEFKDIKEGHYRLEVDGGALQDMFDVEITKKVPPTAWVTIDVSPNFPDCSGGHEFEVRSAKK